VPLLPFFHLAFIFRPSIPPVRLRRSRPFSTPLPLDNDFALFHSTDLSLRPPSAWRLSTFPCAPLVPDNDSIALCSMALSLHPSSSRWFPTSAYAPLSLDNALHPSIRLRICQLLTCFSCAHLYLCPARTALAFDQAPNVDASPLAWWTPPWRKCCWAKGLRTFFAWPNVPPPLSSCCSYVFLSFLLTFFPCDIFFLVSIQLSFFLRSWHLRGERAFVSVSCAIRLLSLVPTSKSIWPEPSIKACWNCRSKWRDVNFKTWHYENFGH
jgi:hypothetical protein